MPKKIKVTTESVKTDKPVVFVKFMHMGKGKHVAKGFDSLEEAKEWAKGIKPWMESGKVMQPELIPESGLLEIIE